MDGPLTKIHQCNSAKPISKIRHNMNYRQHLKKKPAKLSVYLFIYPLKNGHMTGSKMSLLNPVFHFRNPYRSETECILLCVY